MKHYIKISQHPAATAADLDNSKHCILLQQKDESGQTSMPDMSYTGFIAAMAGRHGHDDEAGAPLVIDLPNKLATRLSYNAITTTNDQFRLLTLARRHVEAHSGDRPEAILLCLYGFDDEAAERVARAFVLALAAADFPLPRFGKQAKPVRRLASIMIHGLPCSLDEQSLQARIHGNNLARYLTALPANHLRPGDYLARIRKLAKEEGWQLVHHDRKALEKMGAGAFLAVCQGSDDDEAGIVQLRYRPKPTAGGKRRTPSLALVGKGICFDTGGVNLKPAKHMHGMHEDMQGSAVALGSLLACSRLQVPFAIDCWLALAVNDIGPGAFRQNEVVTALDGQTIEIVHTDAEGRMVLADTLTLAARERPDLIIDYATLTGACVYALSTRYSGACTNEAEHLHEAIIAAGRESGERVWPFPLDEDFEEPLESKIADIKQCTLEGEADQIIAARFLQRFVDRRPWIHIDLSAGNHKGGLAHIPSDISGFGVLFTVSLLLKQQALDTVRQS